MRFLIANLVSEDHVGFANIEKIIPDIYQNVSSAFTSARLAQPVLVAKSHEPFRNDYQKVVYIARDPRDVLLSYFFYLKKKGELRDAATLESFGWQFVDGPWDSFGPWGSHVVEWIERGANGRDFLLVRYEDLLGDPHAELRRIASFLGIGTDRVGAAVAASNLREMQRLEDETAANWRTVRGSRHDIRFVRSGQVGEGARALPPSLIEHIAGEWSMALTLAGYNLDQTA